MTELMGGIPGIHKLFQRSVFVDIEYGCYSATPENAGRYDGFVSVADWNYQYLRVGLREMPVNHGDRVNGFFNPLPDFRSLLASEFSRC